MIWKKEAFQRRGFFTEGYAALKQDLIRKLDAKIYRAILDAYIQIEQLRVPSYKLDSSRLEFGTQQMIADKDQNRKRCEEVTATILKTIALLK